MTFMDMLGYYTLIAVGAVCFLVLAAFALITVMTLISDAVAERQGSKKMYIITYRDYGIVFKTTIFARSMERAVKKFERRVTPLYEIIDMEERYQ